MRNVKSALLFMLPVFLLSGIAFEVHEVYAHCDTMEGPVIKDAQAALDKGDVTPVLKWVKKDAEGQVRSAFQTALTERAKGKDAREKADMKFFETLVRVHRTGEKAPYEGLKSANAVEPIVSEADKAIEDGSADALTAEMSGQLAGEVKERFDRVFEKKKHMNESVEAGREYVEAYVEYLHYIEDVHNAVAGKDGHHQETAIGNVP